MSLLEYRTGQQHVYGAKPGLVDLVRGKCINMKQTFNV